MKKKKAGSMAVMLLILIYLLIPLVVSIIYSMFDKWTGIAPEGFNLGNYATLFSDPEFLVANASFAFLSKKSRCTIQYICR